MSWFPWQVTQPGSPTSSNLCFMWVVLEELGDLSVTNAACIGHAVDLRRHGAVVAVAVVARRCAQVALIHHRLAVHALPPFGVFVASKRLAVV